MKINDVIKKSNEFLEELDNIVDRKVAEIKKKEIIKNYQGDDKVISYKEVYEIEKEKEYTFISTGYETLDKYLGGGVVSGEIVLLTGYSGFGKTTFAMNLTRNMENQNCLWLPFEEPADEMARKDIIWSHEPIKFYVFILAMIGYIVNSKC